MKLIEVKLQNFRSYRDEFVVPIDDLTVIVGKNDAGKSTILEALDIFFNDAPIEKEDASVNGDPKNVRISCIFKDLPEQIVLDVQRPTTLQDEFLLRADKNLEICRVFNCSSSKGKESRIFARGLHPATEGCSDLHGLTIKELKKRAERLEVDVSGIEKTVKTELRRAIWKNSSELRVSESEIDLTKETGRAVWDQVRRHLPVYALFKSDRASTDQDGEAQDPMKAAIKEVVKKHEQQLADLVGQVKTELERVAKRTVEKIQDMNETLASSLDPQVKHKGWESLFSVNLTGEEGISINKRGSGTRRLVLLNFFRAKAEDEAADRKTGVIYAIEEPETSQHPNHQKMLFDAFQDLCEAGTAQILLTTHNPTLARKADRASLRFITVEDRKPILKLGNDDATLHGIKDSLGVLPDHDVKVFVGVEGKWDIEFLLRISRILHDADPEIPDLGELETKGELVFIPLGGSCMELWVSRLAGLERPEIYITDRDTRPPKRPKYHRQLEEWNERQECWGVCTEKRELENYLHANAIRIIAPNFPEMIGDFDDVPLMLAEALHTADPSAPLWSELGSDKQKHKGSKAKRRLNMEVADAMTIDLIKLSDPKGEIENWFRWIGKRVSGSNL